MNPKLLLSLLACTTFVTISHAAVLVNFDGDAGVVTAGVNFGTSANTVFMDTDPLVTGNDTVRSIISYGTALATNGVGTYTGPTMKGGLYMNAIYSTEQTDGIQGTWSSIINNVAGDYIQMRRNGNGSALATSITSGVFTFDTGGSFAFDGTSAFSLTGGVAGATSDIGRWVVVNDGTTYISESFFDPNNSNNTTVYTLSNPASTNWATWAPNSDLSNVPDFSTTVVGSSLSAISEAGFFFERIGSTGQNPIFRAFTADLSTVPEPSTYAALAGCLALVCAAYARKRMK